jgi:hypothetical protein
MADEEKLEHHPGWSRVLLPVGLSSLVGLSSYLLPSLSHFFQDHSILFRLGLLSQTVALYSEF